MFYNKESSLNSDYYNAYGYTCRANTKESILNTIIKVLAIILLLSFLLFGYIFITKERQRSMQEHQLFSMESDEVLEGSQVPTKLSNQELLKIARMVMLKMQQKQHPSLAPQEEDSSYAQTLQNQETDSLEEQPSDLLEMKQINAHHQIQPNASHQEKMDHYNKVIIPESKKINDFKQKVLTLAQQSPAEKNAYTDALRKELGVRSNEMRVIVVKPGDTLSKIAYRAYKDYRQYPKILMANPELIHNPDKIFVGQRLRIPR